MSPEEHEKLKNSMRRFGIVDPFIVRRRDNLVIGGHQRLEDALELGFARVPIVCIDATEREVKALNLALNKISGDWDEDKLAAILADLKETSEIALTGFDQAEIDKIIADAEIPDLGNGAGSTLRTAHLSLVPYVGGKQKLVPHLVGMMPQHIAYVEVFGGGASLLLNKPRSQIEVYNDLDGELVNLFETIRADIDAFLKRAEFLLYSREIYEKWYADINASKAPEDNVERALRFWYVARSSFASHGGWAFARSEARSLAVTVVNALEELRSIHERLKTVEIDHLDFRECIQNRDAASTFFFVDPPYLETSNYRVGKFTLDDHKALAEILTKVAGRWVMTVGDHPDIRELYKGQMRGAITSSTSVEKPELGGSRTEFRNLIISNYPLPQQVLQVAQEA